MHLKDHFYDKITQEEQDAFLKDIRNKKSNYSQFVMDKEIMN